MNPSLFKTCWLALQPGCGQQFVQKRAPQTTAPQTAPQTASRQRRQRQRSRTRTAKATAELAEAVPASRASPPDTFSWAGSVGLAAKPVTSPQAIQHESRRKEQATKRRVHCEVAGAREAAEAREAAKQRRWHREDTEAHEAAELVEE